VTVFLTTGKCEKVKLGPWPNC